MPNRMSLTLMVVGLLCASCRKSAEQAGNAENTARSAASAQAASGLLSVGQTAPDIEAVAHTGQPVKLSSFRGRPLVVYFYPKDDTPGCTIEAQELRDDSPEFAKSEVVVLGVSTDDNTSHRAFAEKYQLPFLLLPDSDQTISRAFGVPLNNGHAKRVTFVIDKQGKIAKVFPDVTPKGHAAEVLSAVRSLGG
jgi:thioredoxin-dependent peroxiredoxin